MAAPRGVGGGDSSDDDDAQKRPIIARSAVELQRLKLEKLLKNPDKPVLIPERPKERNLAPPPDFVRNVMGSSAGAGSGEFHVYRHLRRKEYARQKFIQERAEKDSHDEEYHRRLEEKRKEADERTAKKRAKRLKKKEKQKEAKKKKLSSASNDIKETDSSSDSEKGE